MRKYGGEGKGFVGGEVGFLQADNVRRSEKIADARGNEVTAVSEVKRGAIVGQAVDVVRGDPWDRERKVGEKKVGGGRVRRLKMVARHGRRRKMGNGGWISSAFSCYRDGAWSPAMGQVLDQQNAGLLCKGRSV